MASRLTAFAHLGKEARPMRSRVLSILLLILGGITALSLTHGQDQVPTTPLAPTGQVSPPEPTRAEVAPPSAGQPAASGRDFAKLNVLQKEMLLSGQRAADWLFRMNGLKGRFLYGYLPAVKSEMEGDHYLRQAGAAFALARAAQFLGEERYAVRATQAILTLLDETIPDPADPSCRYTALPSLVVNRLGSAALLVLAIHALPNPQPDLLEKAEQLCQYIRRQARADGSLGCHDAVEADKPEAEDIDSVSEYPGLALYALVRSQKRQPASWKLELVRKAVSYYRPWWQAHRNLAFIPWQTAANAEAYVQTKDPAFGEFVYEMTDWLCGLQYDQLDPRRLAWYGGFRGWAAGTAVESTPNIGSAVYAESLGQACRVARAATDVTHYQHYTEAEERALQFVVRLQYTDANAQHFADWYRPRLVGAFHASFQDGDLRIDYTQHALSALLTYLEEAGR
jgi:hypothetical protein